MKKLLFFLSFLSHTLAQDIHFSQINETPILFNPAVTGNFDGNEQLTVNQRSQWIGGNTTFSTFSLAAEFNLFKKRANLESNYLGLGFIFFNDEGGDSKLGTRSGAISLSGIVPLQLGHKLSAGIQLGFANRFIDLSKVYFENQWNGSSYSELLPSSEQADLLGFNYVDASAGLVYSYSSKKKSFIHKRGINLQIGFSGSHLNQPRFNYFGISGEQLYRKFAFFTNFSKNLKNDKIGFDLNTLVFLQGPHHQELIGGMIRYNFDSASSTFGKRAKSYLGFGVFYRFRDAFIPKILLVRKGFKFGVSYDLTTSLYKSAAAIGTLEFNLVLTNFNRSLFRKK